MCYGVGFVGLGCFLFAVVLFCFTVCVLNRGVG